MPSNIFSTYSTAENRITASVLAVLRSLSLGRIERILGALMEESEFELVRFENQIAKGGDGVPDGLIASSCRILLETKTSRNAVKLPQLQRHLAKLRGTNESTRVLLVLTPDDHRPAVIEELREASVTWASFSTLDQAIEELIADKKEVISEREEFLLRELQTMLLEEALIGSTKDVLVVPARNAWPEYQRIHAYVCQASRPFQKVERMAFYSAGQIQATIPRILDQRDSVQFIFGKHEGWVGELIDRLLSEKAREEGATYKILKLSNPEDPETLVLKAPVFNDLRSERGRPIAFTQNQRYVSLEKLLKAQKTSDLLQD